MVEVSGPAYSFRLSIAGIYSHGPAYYELWLRDDWSPLREYKIAIFDTLAEATADRDLLLAALHQTAAQ